MFHDPADFPFAATLRDAWREIRDEFRGVRGLAAPWFEAGLHDGGWDVFGLYGWPDGAPTGPGLLTCPRSIGLLGEAVPGLGAAGFSVLRPGARIKPHTGYQGDFLRLHLGLEVPEGDCALRVAGETRRWGEGELLVFDDRVEHEAWNLTASPRAVLLVDFVPPGQAARANDPTGRSSSRRC